MTALNAGKPLVGALHWVKLPLLPVSWPACVYQSYSDAVSHTHDVLALRNAKPALDAEDRVIYFFGVGPRACRVVAAGAAPPLQLCVVHKDDLMLDDWTPSADDSAQGDQCPAPVGYAARAPHNACFVRACQEAQVYAQDVRNDEEARELFVALLTRTNKGETKEDEAVGTAVDERNKQKLLTQQTKHKTKSVAELLELPTMKTIVAKCWQQMLVAGWETMVQQDGHVLYKMPGTSFFDVVPNVNLFDSLEKACAKYLSEWVRATGIYAKDDSFELTEFLWPMAAASGWESMSTTTATLYKKADTPFDQWVPNVTIFRTKTQAVAKYLEESGLVESECDDPVETIEKSVTESGADEFDVESEVHPLENEEEPSDEDCDANEECVDANGKKNHRELDDGFSVTKAVRKKCVPKSKKGARRGQPSTAVAKTTGKQVKAVKSAPKDKNPTKSIPSFEMSFGKLEKELKNRGWYWKAGSLQWLYYQPHCKTTDKSCLEPNKDFFRGREELEAYAYSSGLYDRVRTKLEEDHYEQYVLDSEEGIGGDGNTLDHTQSVKALVHPRLAKPKPQPKKTLARRDVGYAKSSSQFRGSRSKSTARGMTTQTTLAEVKFGEIWRVLSEDGWHYLPGKIEYDYFKPHCATIRDGTAGVDFFQSKDLLVEYLQTSGLWDKTAVRVRAEAAMDSSDEDLIDSDDEATTPMQKRKREASTPAVRQEGKRHKNASLFCTPIDGRRAAVIDATVDDDKEIDKTISPDAAGLKGKDGQKDVHGRQPLRNLSNSFTPTSDVATKKTRLISASKKAATEPAKSVGPQDMTLSAVQKLTSAYIPTNFRYREKEFGEICEFFRSSFDGKDHTSLYISGAPGCGKTALLKSVQSDINDLYWECCPEQANTKPVWCHVNAMTLVNSSALFCKLAEALTKKSFSHGSQAFEAIERATTRRLKTSKTMILILDEIDTLLNNNGIELDLCRLFELAHRTSHSFILVGIANQVDFTERHLPMLKQRLPDCSPRVVVFEPYKHQVIEQILVDRLGGQTAASKLVSSHGISFLARKIASTTGDIRLAVDTCRRVLQHKLDEGGKENSDKSSGDNEHGRPLPLTDMLRIIKHALESKSTSAIRSLPRNLQMILFASTRLLIVTANRAAAEGSEATPLFGVNELYACYCEVSKDAGVFKPLAERDFRTALDTLGKEGLIAEAELRKHLIKLLFSTSELLQSFRQDAFFSRLV
ncbi:unnamed protein product [Hyaloperonospora brassicae]|uniref:AAA+ ATPase domain-containing protein n=1 Tax=Hyaloperonospora brassicae TaxID=162125 RepID=A0AAV0UWX3_HYABA|nr:unnamed protein product [Hyaloperonospora brassicae]